MFQCLQKHDSYRGLWCYLRQVWSLLASRKLTCTTRRGVVRILPLERGLSFALLKRLCVTYVNRV